MHTGHATHPSSYIFLDAEQVKERVFARQPLDQFLGHPGLLLLLLLVVVAFLSVVVIYSFVAAPFCGGFSCSGGSYDKSCLDPPPFLCSFKCLRVRVRRLKRVNANT